MAHISSINASLFSDLRYTTTAIPSGTPAFAAIEGLSGLTAVPHVRDFPAFGTPANVVNVPVYGSTVSHQIQGQSDPSDLTFTLNYVPSAHADIHSLVGNGISYTFLLRLAPAALPSNIVQGTQVDLFYFRAQFGSFEVTPSLSDATQAGLTLVLGTDFFGPLTS